MPSRWFPPPCSGCWASCFGVEVWSWNRRRAGTLLRPRIQSCPAPERPPGFAVIMVLPVISAAPRPRPGDTVLGCFRLEREIGAGSFATAYLAEQLGTDRHAVVKIPHAHLLQGPNGAELRRRF